MSLNKKTKEEILKEIIASRTKPFTIGKKEFSGDIFYSDIWYYCKTYSIITKKRNMVHRYLCDELRKHNFYVHS